MRRLLPALAVAQAAGIAAADRGLVRTDGALVLGAAACLAGVALARGPRLRAALALVAAAAAGALALGVQLDAADAGRPARPQEGTLEATVREVVATGRGAWRVELEVAAWLEPEGLPGPGRARLWLSDEPGAPAGLEAALPGERVRVRARLAAPGARRNPGGPDAGVRARRAGLAAVGRLVHPSLHARLPEREGWRPLAGVHARRARASERLAALGPGGALLRALALGEQGALDPALRDACAALGISHLLSVSGLHLALVAGLVFAGARRALARSAWLAARRDTRRIALGIAFGAAALYAVLAGAGVPVQRSLVMLAAVAAAALAGRPGAAPASLAAAVVAVLAFEPDALFDPGAQLSFAGSAALAGVLGAAASRAPRGAGLRAAAADGLRASATALLATAPIAAAHFGRSAPAALVANALAVPWTGFALLPGALVAASLALLPRHPAIDGALAAIAWVAQASGAACEALASALPAPPAGAPPGGAWLAGACLLAALGLRARSTALRIAAAAAQGLLLSLPPPAPLEPFGPRAVFLDVGQGDAALVQAEGAAVLVDAGGAYGGGPDPGRALVAPALRALGVRRLDLLVVSHGDLDHRGGVPGVLASLPVGEVWLPFGARADPSFGELLAAAAAARVPVRERGAGSPSARLGALRVSALWPPPAAGEAASRNDRSLVVRIDAEPRRVLLPGDLEASAEAALLASGADLRADVLKLAHHGSRTSSTPAFLDAVGSALAVASAPCEGRFGMPHRVVVERAHEAGAALWWTGRDGAVRVGLGAALHALGTGEPLRCGAGGAGAR